MAALLDTERVGRHASGRHRAPDPMPCYGPRVAHLLRGYVIRSGLSDRSIALSLGMSASTITRIIGGCRRTTRRTLILIARAIGCTPEEADSILTAAGYAPAWAESPPVCDLVYVMREGSAEERVAARRIVTRMADRIRARSCLAGTNIAP